MNTIDIKGPHEGVQGTDRDDWLLSLDERALPHREALMAMAEHLYGATLVGNPAPKVEGMLQRLSNPCAGDMVVEISTIYGQRDPERRVRALGVLLEKRQEWASSEEEWQQEVAVATECGWDPGLRATHTVWYVQYGPNAADICRWENCQFLMLPIDLKAFETENGVGNQPTIGRPGGSVNSTNGRKELVRQAVARNREALRRLGE